MSNLELLKSDKGFREEVIQDFIEDESLFKELLETLLHKNQSEFPNHGLAKPSISFQEVTYLILHHNLGDKDKDTLGIFVDDDE